MSCREAVSVIIPTHNRAGGLLERAIDSVLAQVDWPFELIVVDDGSSDATAALLASHGSQLQMVRQDNQGPAAARNRGIEAARYNLLAFLDSDDWWHPKKLARQAAAMANQPDYLISHTDEIWYRSGVLLNQKKKHARPHGEIFARCLPLCCVGMSTVMARRNFFAEVGFFDESFPCCEDYELWLRASMTLPFLKIDEALTCKEGGRPDQVSVRYRVGMDRFRIRALAKAANLPTCTTAQGKALAAEIIRKATIYAAGCLKHGRPAEASRYQRKIMQWRQVLVG